MRPRTAGWPAAAGSAEGAGGPALCRGSALYTRVREDSPTRAAFAEVFAG